MKNFVTIYSNGMAHFTRHLGKVTPNQRVSIPVKTSGLDSALGTLAVFGNVLFSEPPSFPSQEDESKILQLDPNNVNRDLYTKLSGSEVTLTRKNGQKVSGTLTGTQDYTEQNGVNTVEKFKVTVLSAGKLVSLLDDDIEDCTFTQEAIQQAVTKALARNFNKINPDSTLLEFALSPLPDQEDTSAVYQLAVPFAAWQPVYQLRLKNGKLELEASAKIDNPTDEDLKDTIFSVVTGSPRSFETDLAEVRIPKRQRVNIVSDTAEGAVTMNDGMPEWNTESYLADDDDGLEAAGGSRTRGAVRAKGVARAQAAPVAACAFGGPGAGSRAVADQATTKDVADFAIYTSKSPLSLGRKRSATIPLFTTEVQGESVLVYKDSEGGNRPLRAVKVKNSTKYSLSKGSVTVFNDDTYQGQSILAATKPGEEKLVPHATENSVFVLVNPPGSSHGQKSRRTRIEITKGVVVYDSVNTSETVYRFLNSQDKAEKLEIEHTRRLHGNDVTATYAGNSGTPLTLENGWRIPATLTPKKEGRDGQLEVRVTETQPQRQTITLEGDYGVRWLVSNIIDVTNPPEKLAKSKKIANVIEAAKKVSEAQQALAKVQKEAATLTKEQNRLLPLMTAGSGSQKETWQKEAATNQEKLNNIEQVKVPELEGKVEEAQEKLNEVLRTLTCSWVEGEDNGERA